jgi:hypothetical protein
MVKDLGSDARVQLKDFFQSKVRAIWPFSFILALFHCTATLLSARNRCSLGQMTPCGFCFIFAVIVLNWISHSSMSSENIYQFCE